MSFVVAVHQPAHPAYVKGREAAEFAAPYPYLVAGIFEAAGHLRGIIANASELRGELTGNQMPPRQTGSM